jgi:hypothetical protein
MSNSPFDAWWQALQKSSPQMNARLDFLQNQQMPERLPAFTQMLRQSPQMSQRLDFLQNQQMPLAMSPWEQMLRQSPQEVAWL